MRSRALVAWVLSPAIGLAVGCVGAPEPPELPPAPEVSFLPADSGRPLRTARFTVRARGLDPADLLLFEGEVSDTRLARLAQGELPKTLESARVPLLGWSAQGDVLAQPLRELEPGAVYTLAGVRSGALARFRVSELTVPRLERLWPPPMPDLPAGGSVVLCGEELPSAPGIELDPGSMLAEVIRDFGWNLERPCLLVQFDATPLEGRTLVLPPEVDGVSIAPDPLVIGVRETALNFPVCDPNELELGPACATVEDDRIVLRNADQPLLYRFEAFTPGGDPLLEVAPASGAFVVRGLPADSSVQVQGRVIATDGAEASFAITVKTQALRARLVLNEVLANPNGPEPAAEWVELYNAGAVPVNVAGMQLRDAGGTVELPEGRIPAGGYALLVREDFAPSPLDIAPAPDTLLIRVPVLAKSGLTNAGEPLWLLDAGGELLSEFPAFAAPKGGISIARRRPDALASDTTAFGEHGAPGASPGAPNFLNAK